MIGILKGMVVMLKYVFDGQMFMVEYFEIVFEVSLCFCGVYKFS